MYPFWTQIHNKRSVKFKKNSLFSIGAARGMRVLAGKGGGRNGLLLDTSDGLNLRSLGMGAKLLEVFVISTVAVTLHDVLVSTVTRVLVAHKPEK